MSDLPFVEPGFVPPAPPRGDGYLLTQLLVEHNEADLAAWSSSVEHIHATPGFEQRPWPDEPMTLERNRADLQAHVDDFASRPRLHLHRAGGSGWRRRRLRVHLPVAAAGRRRARPLMGAGRSVRARRPPLPHRAPLARYRVALLVGRLRAPAGRLSVLPQGRRPRKAASRSAALAPAVPMPDPFRTYRPAASGQLNESVKRFEKTIPAAHGRRPHAAGPPHAHPRRNGNPARSQG